MFRQVFVMAMLSFAATGSQAAAFTPIGYGVYAQAVSANGSVVVGIDSGGQRWTQATGWVGLPAKTGYGTRPLGISGDGSVIVGINTPYYSGNEQAFRWTASDGLTTLPFDPSNQSDAAAQGASYDGSVVVGWGGAGAIRWTQQTGAVSIGSLLTGPYAYASASAVSGDGSTVVGGSGSNSGGTFHEYEAFRWTQAGGMVGLGFLPGGAESLASSTSANGQQIVGWADSAGGVQATRWTQLGGMMALGFLPGFTETFAHGVSDDGSVVIGTACNRDPNYGNGFLAIFDSDQFCATTRALVWTPSTGLESLQDLLVARGVNNLNGWDLQAATALTPDGTSVVGYGLDSQGSLRPFIASLVPIPPAALLFPSALAALGWVRRRVAS